jgi:hypothetical protein
MLMAEIAIWVPMGLEAIVLYFIDDFIILFGIMDSDT